MGRYGPSDDGERRTSALRVQLTPGERAAIEAAAQRAGLPLSRFVRALCLRRHGMIERVAGTRSNPEARDLIRQLAAVGNNLNQLTRLAHIHGTTPSAEELGAMIGLLKAVMDRVLAL